MYVDGHWGDACNSNRDEPANFVYRLLSRKEATMDERNQVLRQSTGHYGPRTRSSSQR